MKFDILTYIFEIINFFILLWILKKILYNPVISVLKKRKQYIDENIRKAEEAESKYTRLQEDYEKTLKEIEEIKKSKMAEIEKEIERQREILYNQMKQEIDAEREKFLESLETHKKETLNEIKGETIKLSLEFISKFLSYFADEHIHKKLFELSLEAIKNINPEEIDNIAQELKEHPKIYVETAFHLDKESLEKIKNLIKEIFGVNVDVEQKENKELKAGAKIFLSSKMIDTSLEGQISVFETLLRKKLEI